MRSFLAELVLPYDRRVASEWGHLQAYAATRPVNDTWIAACCLVRELQLIRK